jgi:hypothetical protein
MSECSINGEGDCGTGNDYLPSPVMPGEPPRTRPVIVGDDELEELVGDVINKLGNSIELSHLAQSLRERIGLITTLQSGLNQINTVVATENSVFAQQLIGLRRDLTSAVGYINSQLNIEVDERAVLVNAVNQTVAYLNSQLSAAIQEETTVRAEQTGALFAEKTVKADLAGNITGYGLSAYTDPTGAFTSDFRVAADKFSIAPPTFTGSTAPPIAQRHIGKVWRDTSTNPNVTKWWNGNSWQTTPVKEAQPFVYLSTPTTLPDGTKLDPGLYVNSAKITKLSADKIDTRGLTIKDDQGNVIFGAGTGLPARFFSDYFSNNLIPDDGFKDPSFWFNSPSITTWPNWMFGVTGTTAEQPHRYLVIKKPTQTFSTPGGSCNKDTGTFDFQTSYVPARKNGRYIVRLKMFLSSNFQGRIGPLVHFPNVRWALPDAGKGYNMGVPDTAINKHNASTWNPGEWREFDIVITNKPPEGSSVQSMNKINFRLIGQITQGQVELHMTVMPVMGTSDIIDVDTIGTYIEGAAITNAYIGNAAIDSAKIGDLSVDSLKIKDGSVTFLSTVDVLPTPIRSLPLVWFEGAHYRRVALVDTGSVSAGSVLTEIVFNNNHAFQIVLNQWGLANDGAILIQTSNDGIGWITRSIEYGKRISDDNGNPTGAIIPQFSYSSVTTSGSVYPTTNSFYFYWHSNPSEDYTYQRTLLDRYGVWEGGPYRPNTEFYGTWDILVKNTGTYTLWYIVDDIPVSVSFDGASYSGFYYSNTPGSRANSITKTLGAGTVTFSIRGRNTRNIGGVGAALVDSSGDVVWHSRMASFSTSVPRYVRVLMSEEGYSSLNNTNQLAASVIVKVTRK